jgi:hypothetical protein
MVLHEGMKAVSRRQMLASVPAVAMTSTAALGANDPAFAAIDRCRAAMQAWDRSPAIRDETPIELLYAVDDAFSPG